MATLRPKQRPRMAAPARDTAGAGECFRCRRWQPTAIVYDGHTIGACAAWHRRVPASWSCDAYEPAPGAEADADIAASPPRPSTTTTAWLSPRVALLLSVLPLVVLSVVWWWVAP
jgi:hypothetical protein